MRYFISDFKDGVRAYFDAARVIREQRLWIYLLAPGLISLLFGGLVAWGALALGGEASDLVEAKYPWEFGANFVYKIAGFLGTAMTFGVALLTYKYVVLILVAPFMSPLSERVERFLTGRTEPGSLFDAGRVVRELIRGIRVSLRNIIRELFFSLLVIIVTAILPLLALVSAPAIFAIQAYYAGFGNMDFTLERHYGVRGSVRFVRGCKGLAVGNGTVFLLLLMIPVVGLLLAPGLSTVAATIESVERMDPSHP